jgi:uncharacterized protein
MPSPVETAAAQQTAVPTAVPDRIQIVDILRGFALGGILIANMTDFSTPFYYIEPRVLWPQLHNLLVLAFIQIFVTGNFFTIFSFLFGLGLALQMRRLEARGVPFVPIYLRRQAILFCFGLAQGMLVWYGDILAPYALFGCALLLFRHWPPRRLVVLAACLILVPFTVSVTRMLLSPGAFLAAQGDHTNDAAALAAAQQVIAVYAHGSWMDIFRQRLGDLMVDYHGWLGRNYGLTVFSMFLLGLAAGVSSFFNNLDRFIPIIRKLWYIGVTCLCVSAAWTVMSSMDPEHSAVLDLVYYQFLKIANIFICLFYVASVILLARNRRWHAALSILRAPGRMALTNYLLQALVFTTLFNSYGLGLFGNVSPLAGFGLSLLFYAGEVAASNWFLSRFKFGPAEWVWKSLTYGRRQAFVRTR